MSTIAEFAQQYGGFVLPNFAIKIENVELKKDQFQIMELSVDLSTGDICSACKITVGAPADDQSKVEKNMVDTFGLGSTISVSLGYGGTVKPVFKGFVYEMQYSFDEDGVCLIVFCMDVRALMRRNKITCIYTDMTTDALIRQKLSAYSGLVSIGTLEVDDIESQTRMVQNVDDLSFLLKIAEKRDLMLYVENGVFFMVKSSSAVCLTLSRMECNFQIHARYLYENIICAGASGHSGKHVSQNKIAVQKANQTHIMQTKQYITFGSHFLGDKLKTLADSLAHNEEQSAIFGEITLLNGIPDVQLAQKVSLTDAMLTGAGVGKEFTITAISHVFDPEHGLQTKIQVQGV